MRSVCLAACVLLSGVVIHGSTAQAQGRGEAYVGRPYGVVRMTVPGPRSSDAIQSITHGYSITEQNGRTLFPVFTTGGPLGPLRQRLGVNPETGGGNVTVLFLFRGDEPLDVTIATDDSTRFRIEPENRPRAHARLLRAWWRNYSAVADSQIRQGDYPPLVETYLTTILARRLQLPPPLLSRLGELQRSGRSGSLSLLLNTEAMRLEALKQSLSGSNRADEVADQPVPAPVDWQPNNVGELIDPVATEEIAAHVPEECFYIRFGTFDNYLWLRGLMDENGGDISRMVTARGHDAGLNQRMQDQLGLKETALAKILGGQVISDVALIGRDTYLREGAAIGIMFEARNGLLQNDLMKQRREAVARFKDQGAEMTTVEIDGQQVSFASTKDNRLRSFYAIDGKFHLVTTSQEMIRRFYEAGKGVRPLDQSPEFRLARSDLPLERDDTVFVFMSPAFFQGLMSPHYQIELRRRLQAVTDLELLQMAYWVGRLEGRDDLSLDGLISAGLLPRSVRHRADGSHPIQEADRPYDSMRGGRGTFLPIPDVELVGATRSEVADYQQLKAFHASQWNQMDPIVVALKRFSLPEEHRERLRIEARILPFDRLKYGRLTSIVGPPSRMQLRPPNEDIINLQLVVQGGLLMPDVKPHLLFFGLHDADVPLDFGRSSLLRTLTILQKAPAYLGAWPKLGLLDLIPIGTPPDAAGFSRLPFGLWRRQSTSGFSLISFDPQVLETTLPQLQIERSDYLAQARVRIGDVSQAKLRPWFEALNYQRALQTSTANARLLHTISQQLGVPRHQAKDVAESILGVDLMCTLGGEYLLSETKGGLEHWVSNRWPGMKSADDVDFTSPIMQWFRGLDADVIMLHNRVIAYATLDMQRQAQAAGGGGRFPLFNLFRDNPFKRQKEEEIEPVEPDPFEELPPPKPTPE